MVCGCSTIDDRSEIGSQIYWFQSPQGARETRVIIWAHGLYAWKWRDSYVVPANTNLYFYCPPDTSLEAWATDLIAKPYVIDPDEDPGYFYESGDRLPDYLLYKPKYNLQKNGKVLSSSKLSDFDKKFDYHTLNDVVQNRASRDWAPHVATIRNRLDFWRNTKQIRLSEVVDQIRKVHPHITDFYCAFCRPAAAAVKTAPHVAYPPP
jgi:hypothetical protein